MLQLMQGIDLAKFADHKNNKNAAGLILPDCPAVFIENINP